VKWVNSRLSALASKESGRADNSPLALSSTTVCLRGAHKVHHLENARTDGGIVVVFDSLPCNGDILEVTAEIAAILVVFDPLEVMEAFTGIMPSVQSSQAFI
jgi:hypothetical protein